MPYRGRCKLVQMFASAAIGGIALLMANSGVALAAYGPPPPPPGTVPGGFSCVVTSLTVGPAGKLIGPIRLGGLEATIDIQRGTFPVAVQITITEPFGVSGGCQGGPGIGDGGFRGDTAVGGVGILVQRNGSAYTGTFRRPITVRVTSSSIGPSSLVVVWNGTRFVLAPADLGGGSATIRVFASGDYAVLTPGLDRRLARRSFGPAARPGLRGVGTAADFLVAALLRPAGGPPPGAGVLLATQRPAADTSHARRLP
jgi:hypothetical protein